MHLLAIEKPQADLPKGVHLHDMTKIVNVRKLRYAIWSLVARRLLKRIKPDLVHAHWISGAGWVAAAAGYHPLMVSVLGSDLLVLPKRSAIHRLLTKWVLDRADYITCVSERLMEEARGYGVPECNLELVCLGVDTTMFYPSSNVDDIRQELDLDSNPVVISIRAFRPLYNPLVIARAISLILETVPETRFLIRTYNADKNLLKSFMDIIQQAGAEHAVRYIPELAKESDIALYYQAADVAVSVASSDGTPVSVQEAMACGTVTVLGDIPAFHGWARHEEETLLVPLHDAESLSAAIIRLLEDHTLRNRVSHNALAYIRANADSVKWMRRSEEIYKTMVAGTIKSGSE